MGLTLGFQVTLSEMYPDEDAPSLAKFLTGIPREKVLLVGSALLAEQAKDFDSIRDLLGFWFRDTNADFANDAYRKLQPIENNYRKLIIASAPAALHMYTYANNHLSDEGTQTEEQIEINLFKCFLFLNGQITSVDGKINETTEKLPVELRWYALHFSNAIRFGDIANYDLYELFVTEFIRAVLFFEFLDLREDAKPLLTEFYRVYDVKDWDQYIQQISGVSLSILRKTKSGYLELTIKPGDSFDRDVAFLDKLSLVVYDELTDNDFKVVREKPIHKIADGRYRIISDLFCIERIFKGLYFNLNGINNGLPNVSKIKSFRNLYTYNYSEQFALYAILSKAFPKKNLKISGGEIESAKYQGGPDYYVRNNNKAFIFESKDSLVNAAVKETGDFTKLTEDLIPKFYKDGNSPKAVLQLLNCILDICRGKFLSIDKDYKKEFIRIYPILVVHDRQLDVIGFNKIINYWFSAELDNVKGEVDVSRIKPITVIDTGTLILVHELLNSRQIALESAIDDFHDFTKLKSSYRSDAERRQHAQDTTLSFSFYLKQIVRKRELKRYPERLLEEKAFIALNENPIKKIET